MNAMMMRAFVDELAKLADSNAGAPPSMKTGLGENSMVSSSSSSGITTPTVNNPMKAATPPKSTNYSIVHSEAPMAAQGTASAVSKAVPPPPVRT
jgi:hypothetical protein